MRITLHDFPMKLVRKFFCWIMNVIEIRIPHFHGFLICFGMCGKYWNFKPLLRFGWDLGLNLFVCIFTEDSVEINNTFCWYRDQDSELLGRSHFNWSWVLSLWCVITFHVDFLNYYFGLVWQWFCHCWMLDYLFTLVSLLPTCPCSIECL